MKKKYINKDSSGFWFKPDIFHPDYNRMKTTKSGYLKKNIQIEALPRVSTYNDTYSISIICIFIIVIIKKFLLNNFN
jgi:hypothetical protein